MNNVEARTFLFVIFLYLCCFSSLCLSLWIKISVLAASHQFYKYFNSRFIDLIKYALPNSSLTLCFSRFPSVFFRVLFGGTPQTISNDKGCNNGWHLALDKRLGCMPPQLHNNTQWFAKTNRTDVPRIVYALNVERAWWGDRLKLKAYLKRRLNKNKTFAPNSKAFRCCDVDNNIQEA